MKQFSKDYLSILNNELKGLNLTRINSEEEFYQKQIIDSILPIEKSKVFKQCVNKKKIILDVGFGGGFPLLPLAKSFPNITCLGAEARRKKADAVQLIAEKLEITNVKPRHIRIEDMLINRPIVITIKAVGTISDLLLRINTDEQVEIFFYKGPNLEELEDLSKISSLWEKIEDISYELEGTDGRRFIGFRNTSVLRGTESMNKNLVNLTDIF